MTTALSLNSRVIHRAHPEYGFGLVRYVEEDALGETRLQVAFDYLDQLLPSRPDELEPVGHPHEDAAAGRWGEVAAFRRRLAAAVVLSEHHLTSCFTRAAVQPLPHQVHVVDRVLTGNRFGHLLADDVGLGKTVEAGLIIAGLLRREAPLRVMVVCPAGLALQWQDELADLFNLHFEIVGVNFNGTLEASWHNQPAVIASIDRIKRKEYRELLLQVGQFDLVICDEAHRLTARRNPITQDLEETQNYRFFKFLVESRLIQHVENPDRTPRSPRLLLLSGTPHQGDDERFLRLLHLPRPDLFQPDTLLPQEQFKPEHLRETLTRTPKSRAVDWEGRPLFKGHDTQTLEVSWSPAEVALSHLLTQYIRRSLEASAHSSRSYALAVALVMHTYHKIAASSWVALQAALERRAENLANRRNIRWRDYVGEDADDEEAQASLDLLDESGQRFFDGEELLLDRLQQALQSLRRDTKWDFCAQLLRDLDQREPGAKILFFTQYRATMDYLCARLAELFPAAAVEIIHGDCSMEERREARRRFEGASRFLVSTEAGGEGINLQKACHLMINYDLPWNPMRLLQRIGRLDRYGQSHRVQVYNLCVPESWDAKISLRIMERLRAVQHTLGLTGVAEDYFEMILGEVASRVDPSDEFTRHVQGQERSDEDLDRWIREAADSVHRLQALLGDAGSFNGDFSAFKPSLTGADFKLAFQLALERHGLRLQDTRNSANQFVRGVYHFELPDAFRDPVFRPSRTCHVVFDREIFLQVRDEDLGRVRGQPIKPVLAGFGEPVTDWLFQGAVEARPQESAFAIQAGQDWPHGAGWLWVYALRWLGEARRLQTPDSVVPVFHAPDKELLRLSLAEAIDLVHAATPLSSAAFPSLAYPAEVEAQAKKLAQQTLRDRLQGRDPTQQTKAGLSLWMVARVEAPPNVTVRQHEPR